MQPIIIIITLVLVAVAFYVFSGTSYERQTQQFEQELPKVLTIETEQERMDSLKELARRIGAGTEHTIVGTPVRVDENTIMTPQTPITESKLVENIHYALQTRNSHSAALAAKKGNYIAFGALVIAMAGLVYSHKTHLDSEKRDSVRFEIEQVQEADRIAAKQKAVISVKLEHLKKGNYVLKLQNDGSVEARNVQVYLNSVEVTKIEGIQPTDQNSIVIGPNGCFSYHWPTGKGPRPPFNTEVRWLDDSAEKGTYTTTLVHPTKAT